MRAKCLAQSYNTGSYAELESGALDLEFITTASKPLGPLHNLMVKTQDLKV